MNHGKVRNKVISSNYQGPRVSTEAATLTRLNCANQNTVTILAAVDPILTRLLNTLNIQLEEPDRPKEYAIVSYCWGEDEVTFDNICTSRAGLKRLAGYLKIEKCCMSARQYGFKYVWINTCCINKRSSSELSEAINLMYNWYRKAKGPFGGHRIVHYLR
jgi:hypothetical protein